MCQDQMTPEEMLVKEFPFLGQVFSLSTKLDLVLREESDQVQQDIICLLEDSNALVTCQNPKLLDEICQKVVDGRQRVQAKMDSFIVDLGLEDGLIYRSEKTYRGEKKW